MAKKSTTSKRKKLKGDEMLPKNFLPRSWEEVENQGVPKRNKKSDPSPASVYEPLNDDPIYVSRWNQFIGDVVKRDNFKKGHLYQLDVLCSLYVEYDQVFKYIQEHGHSYQTITRNGLQYKLFPEAVQLNRIRSEIRSYSKTLGLLLTKDKEHNPGNDDDSWE